MRNTIRSAQRVALAALGLALLSSCGGGGGGGTPDTTAPTATISFPPGPGRTDADSITVTGTATDDRGVALVRVNGIDAVTTNGFASWSASVPLQPGTNNLAVEVTDGAGNADLNAAGVAVLSEPLMTSPSGLVADSAGNRVLVVDRVSKLLLAMDPDGGNRRVITNGGDAAGGVIVSQFAVAALDVAGNRAFLAESGNGRLVAVDLATGARALVPGSGTVTPQTVAIAYDTSLGAGMERVLVADWLARRVSAVDVITGASTTLSDDSNGTGDGFIEPRGLVIDAANNRALVTDFDSVTDKNAAVIAVDLTSGDRTILSPYQGTLRRLAGITLDPSTGLAYAIDDGTGVPQIFSIDVSGGPDQGTQAVVSGDGTGSGTEFRTPTAIAFDPAVGRLLVAEDARDEIVEVSIATGDRATIADNSVGSGEPFMAVEPIVVDTAADRAYTYDRACLCLRGIDLATGDRSVVSSGTVGAGPIDFDGSIHDIELDRAENRILAIHDDGFSVEALFAVDLSSGDRTLVSHVNFGLGELGSGPGFGTQPLSIVLDPAAPKRLLVARQQGLSSIMAVDLDTRDRTILSGEPSLGEPGTGPSFTTLVGLAFDNVDRRVLAMNAAFFQLMAVDAVTGDRTILSNSNSVGVPQFGNEVGQIDLDAARGRVLVTRQNIPLPGLGAIDLATGTSSILSDGDTGKGPRFQQPVSIAVHPGRDLALVTDEILAAVIAVDLGSGDRVIVSK